MEDTLAPLLDAQQANILTDDGSAAVFGVNDVPLESLMFNHIHGDQAWDAIYRVAATGEWAVLPVGGPVCVPSQRLLESIPLELAEAGLVVVTSGAELRAAVVG
ncbi:hypothetical protein [Herbiconiux ginsengi]|uniref:hypothetical protein n=1 Tax=Herbiconiux ginsengi TaxID=381665 RepID=UPI000B8129D1|nr:hypothetical protein [Herbiconiux ginsengi]